MNFIRAIITGIFFWGWAGGCFGVLFLEIGCSDDPSSDVGSTDGDSDTDSDSDRVVPIPFSEMCNAFIIEQ